MLMAAGQVFVFKLRVMHEQSSDARPCRPPPRVRRENSEMIRTRKLENF